MNIKLYTLLIIGMSSMSSCTNYRLFQSSDFTNPALITELIETVQEPLLQPGDRLTVSVFEHENISIGSVNSIYNSDESTGKWLMIDNAGEINLPKVGRVKLTSYNIKEATFYLEQLYAQYIQNPIVNIKVLNHYVTILGEVNSPGKYNIHNSKVRLMDMVGTAQGLTKYAKTDEIKLIRVVDDKIQQEILNLTDINTLLSENYLLQPNDIIYIPPRKTKAFSEFTQGATPIAGIITSIAVVISVFLK